MSVAGGTRRYRAVPIKSLRPRETFVLHGWVCTVERQARRSTFAKVVTGPLAGFARMQLKHGRLVCVEVPGPGDE